MHSVYSALPRRPWAALVVLGLAAGPAWAQHYNTGPSYNTGSLYVGDSFTNTGSAASFVTTGSAAVVSYAGATFTNADGATYGAVSGATDQFVGSGTQTLAGTRAPGFFNLTFANGSASPFILTNVAGADVAGALTLGNGITTTVNNVPGAIRLASNATVMPPANGSFSPARYVDGYVGKAGPASFTYPLGATNRRGGAGPAVGDAVYSPIAVSNPGGTTLRYVADQPANATTYASQSAALQLVAVSTHEYYPASVGTVPQGATITIPYGNFTGTPYVGDPGTLTIAGYDGTRWTNLSGTASNTISAAARTVTVTLPAALSTGYTALALAAVAGAPLPVQLVAFAATASGADAQLSWATASELHNDRFEVERSADGISFGRIGQVAGRGSTATASSYAFRDAGIGARSAGPVYYRLRQVDADGTGTYSPVRVVTFAPLAPAISLAPNPARATTTLDLTLLPEGTYQVCLLDATGRSVLEQSLAAGASHELPVAQLASGVYVVRVTGTALSLTKRLVRE